MDSLWIDAGCPDILDDYRVDVSNSIPVFESAFEEFWQSPDQWPTADFVFPFGSDASPPSSPAQVPFLQNQVSSQTSQFPRELSFHSVSAEHPVQVSFEASPRDLCPESGDVVWNRNMIAEFPGELPNDESLGGNFCPPNPIPVMDSSNVSMTNHFNQPEEASSPGLLAISELLGENLFSHGPASEMVLPELGSSSPSQSPRPCTRVESLHGNRCHWAGCKRTLGTVIELRSHLRHHSSKQTMCLWSSCARDTHSTAVLNKHLDSHIKPYQCPKSGCTRRAATSRDLQRHIQSHGRCMGSTVYYCPCQNCIHNNKGSKPLGRLDNAMRHLRRKHPGFMGNPIPGKLGGKESFQGELITETHQ